VVPVDVPPVTGTVIGVVVVPVDEPELLEELSIYFVSETNAVAKTKNNHRKENLFLIDLLYGDCNCMLIVITKKMLFYFKIYLFV
jgi:hypothetical protein